MVQMLSSKGLLHLVIVTNTISHLDYYKAMNVNSIGHVDYAE